MSTAKRYFVSDAKLSGRQITTFAEDILCLKTMYVYIVAVLNWIQNVTTARYIRHRKVRVLGSLEVTANRAMKT